MISAERKKEKHLSVIVYDRKMFFFFNIFGIKNMIVIKFIYSGFITYKTYLSYNSCLLFVSRVRTYPHTNYSEKDENFLANLFEKLNNNGYTSRIMIDIEHISIINQLYHILKTDNYNIEMFFCHGSNGNYISKDRFVHLLLCDPYRLYQKQYF